MKTTIFLSMLTIAAFLSCKKVNIDHITIEDFKVSGWEVDSIRFNENGADDAVFLNEKTGFIISEGDLLKTTNSAITWSHSFIDGDSTGLKTWALSFINDSTGYVYGTRNAPNGSYGILYKTEDGGSHWTKRYYNTSFQLHSMKFFDIYHGIALYQSSGTNIVTTDNGGLSWQNANIDLDPSLYQLLFIGDMVFATGKNQVIYKSIDHGKTWIAILTPGSSWNYISGFYFINENVGFLNEGNMRYKTTDGGKNWNQINKSFPFFETPSSFETFHFCNDHDGIIFQDSMAYTGGCFPSFIGTYAYTTNNGGESWVKSGLLKFVFFGIVEFASDNFAYCIAQNHIYRFRKM